MLERSQTKGQRSQPKQKKMSSKKFDPDLPKPGTTSFPRENDI